MANANSVPGNSTWIEVEVQFVELRDETSELEPINTTQKQPVKRMET